MLPPTSTTRPRSPVDADLQQLYNDVLSGFDLDGPSLSLQDSSNPEKPTYRGYGDAPSNGNGNGDVGSQLQNRFGPASPASVENNLSPRTSTSASRPSRRLPPTPAGSSITTSPTNSFAMPEPEPSYDSPQSRPGHFNTESYSHSNDLLKKATSLSASAGRALPSTPARGSTSFGGPSTRPPFPGFSSDSRPSTSGYPSSSSVNSRPYLSEKLPYPPENSGSSSSSFRLPQDSNYSFPFPQVNVYDVDATRPTSNGHHYGHSQASATQQYHHHSPSQSLSQNYVVPHQPSDYMSSAYSNYGAPASPFAASDNLSPYADPRLIRSNSSSSQLDYASSAGLSESNNNLSTGGSSTYAASSAYNDYFSQDQQPTTASPAQQNNDLLQGPSHGDVIRRPSDMLHSLANFDHNEQVEYDEQADGYWEDEDEDENLFINWSLLSNIAVQLRDKVPRGTHVKGSIPYPQAFTGKDIVSAIQSLIQRELAINYGISTNDRRVALQVARSLQNQLFFYEVEWGGRMLQDGVEDVYMFLGDQEGGSDGIVEQEELPTGVVTMLTRCFSPSCAASGADGNPCYSYSCPKRENSAFNTVINAIEPVADQKKESWSETVDPSVLQTLPETEINRQTIIHKLITKEEQYIQDLDIVESVFIKPLRASQPPVLPPELVEDFIDEVFGNILDLRECNRRLLEVLYVRQREQGPIIVSIGDIFLNAATEFRLAYPTYIGHHHFAEKKLKEELENNPLFKIFAENCVRSIRQGDTRNLDLKHFLGRPVEHLQKYPVLLEAVYNETTLENADGEYLKEAIDAIKSLQSFSQLRTFQNAMGRGGPGKWDWHDLVSPDYMKSLPKKEAKRQAIIFELIKGEMAYVKDLENIKTMYIEPLRSANPPIIQEKRLDQFIDDVFHNYLELYEHHHRLVEKFHEIQRDEHPRIVSITAAVYDAALNFREAYLEYIPNYPIAAYRIDDEMANNPAFKNFVEACVRHPDAHRLDMKNFINRPIPRLLRYELLLKGIMEESPEDHEDLTTIPNVIEVIKSLGKETEPGVQDAKQKVELWRYNANLVFKHGEVFDMDLLDEKRILVHSGKLLRQPEGGLEWTGWSELFVLLFDNYLVMTKPKERDGVTKYIVYKRPVPLDLLTPVNFTDPPTQRNAGLLRGLRGGNDAQNSNTSPDAATDSRFVYPMTLHHNGRAGGPHILYAETSQSRSEWQSKLVHALAMHKAVQDSNKAFEIETLSSDTFLVPSLTTATSSPAWSQDNAFTGKVTCSVPFNTSDGRRLVAVGCAEGVWIGFRHDPKSLRRVLHLKQVTQCAMLEEFGIFLVLADKSLFAYHIEALVPSSPHTAHQNQVPQKLNGNKDVHFFSVGTLHGRTLVVYMKKKNMDSIFRVLEPVGDKINERVKAPVGLSSRLGFRNTKSEWFRVYRDFFLPSESYDLIFLKARIVILCAKGFEIMDLNNFNSVTIPQREDPKLSHLAKRCESCRPMGMFRSSDDEFLLCYDEFGVYVDKHGDPSRSAGTIEWEGTAERVALHHPYVLLFDSRFIEVRHIETGRLAQIIPGNEIRCIWDGRGVSTKVVPTQKLGHMEQDAQVHGVMVNSEAGPVGQRGAKAIAQCVFELLPTVPLYPDEQPRPLGRTRYDSMGSSIQTLAPLPPHGAGLPLTHNGNYPPAAPIQNQYPSHYSNSSFSSWKPS